MLICATGFGLSKSKTDQGSAGEKKNTSSRLMYKSIFYRLDLFLRLPCFYMSAGMCQRRYGSWVMICCCPPAAAYSLSVLKSFAFTDYGGESLYFPCRLRRQGTRSDVACHISTSCHRCPKGERLRGWPPKPF